MPNIHNGTKTRDNTHPPVFYDVLILGAGLAGLGAALTLSKSKLSFLMLEGQSKAGGRVNTMHLLTSKNGSHDTNHLENANSNNADSPSFIDSGAQWLHGKCNYLHEVAERHDLLSDEQSEEGLGAFIRDDGVVLDEYLVKKTDFLVGEILTECEKYAHQVENGADVSHTPESNMNHSSSETNSRSEPYPKSVNRFLLDNFQKYLDGLNDADQRQQAKQLLDWHVRFQIIDNSCLTLDDVSAKSWGKYSYNGESCQAHYNFRRGFSSAAETLVEEIGVEKFRFGMDVREIHLNVDDERSDLDYTTVRCVDGSEYRAKHVICTFSIGSLKYGLDNKLFRPQLPSRLVQTIRDIGFETINKLFLQFDHTWWGDLDGIQLVFKNDHYENWTRHISGFDVMRPGPKNTLLAWVGGHGALEMETLTDTQIIQDCVELLRQFTGLTVPTPIKYFCTRWRTNPFVRGAYSYISTSCDRNDTSSRHLAEPITRKDYRSTSQLDINSLRIETQSILASTTSKTTKQSKMSSGDDIPSNETKTNTTDEQRPLLLFAGEAVHDQYFSTAHGAFMSGTEQAAKIVDFYNAETALT